MPQQFSLTSFRTEPSSSTTRTTDSRKNAKGFTIIELLIVLTVSAIISSFAVIKVTNALQSYRAMSSARMLAAELALAKMRAANAFTQTRLNCTTTTGSCQIEICTTKSGSTCNTFTAEGSPIFLQEGTTFGFGNVTTPAGTQTTIANSNQVLFNSRGVPVNNTGAPTGNYALYMTNQQGDKYAVTVYATGRVAAWQYAGGGWSIQ
ncbi:MAG TPA: prepilin-type N-terminal cleavage/methylation domain-containing protein [Pyrinomonadaceae bacterium]|nr:prepilin-type N-terminal cleavage/methylation domain-containing protein [Pyrinomonadaceae bacterium]